MDTVHSLSFLNSDLGLDFLFFCCLSLRIWVLVILS